ncbi:hypothetical protein D3C79_789650 [compost metagenome]
MREGTEQFAFLRQHFAVWIEDIRQRPAVALHRHFFWLRIFRGQVIPGHVQQLLRNRTAVTGIHFAQTRQQPRQNFTVVQRFPWGIGPFPVPLQPTARVNDRAVLFGKAGGRQAEHFSLDFRWVNIVELIVVLPEVGGFGVQRINGDQELQLGQRGHHFVLVRE